MQLKSIKIKLTAVIVLILVITSAILVGMSYLNTRTILLMDTEATLSSLARHNADKLGMWLQTRSNELAVMANTPAIVSGERAAAISYLQDENRRNPIYAFFFLVDADGSAELTTGAKPNVADRPYFRQAMTGKIAISDPLLSKVDGKPLVVIAIPILRDKKISGVLAATVSLSDMIDLVNQVKVGQTGYAYVVQHDGLTIFHPDPVVAMKQNSLIDAATPATTRTLLEKMTQGQEGVDDNAGHYTAFAPIAGTSWSMAVNVPTVEMTGALGDLLRSSLLVLTLALVLAVILTLFVAGRFSRPLQRAVAMIEGLGRGELEQRLGLSGDDEVAQLGRHLDAFADDLQHEILGAFEALAAGDLTFQAHGVIKQPLAKANAALNEVMEKLQISAEQIASGSGQVSNSAQSLSQGATESASSLEEISASLNQLSSQTKTNAENASQANQLSVEASQAAEQGSRQMETMVAAMTDINASSQSISRIIKTIDEIAFQTNLLALNAAVEAARAGQHGKGFAVVAEEVRNLAARSAKAAQETSELIEGSVEKTRNGSAIANQTADSLKEIVTGISKVTDLVSEIAAASSEQAQGVSEINQGVGQIDQVTQQNTAVAEESAAAAEELSGQAAQMHEMLQRFTLKTGNQVSSSRPAPRSGAKAAFGWNAAPAKKASAPKQAKIALDDDEFGKF